MADIGSRVGLSPAITRAQYVPGAWGNGRSPVLPWANGTMVILITGRTRTLGFLVECNASL